MQSSPQALLILVLVNGTGLAVLNLKVVSSKELRLVWVSRSKSPSAWIIPTLKTTESDLFLDNSFFSQKAGSFHTLEAWKSVYYEKKNHSK